MDQFHAERTTTVLYSLNVFGIVYIVLYLCFAKMFE